MKIALPNPGYELGGSGTFRRNWRAWLDQQGIQWTENLHEDYDILFINAWQTPYRTVYQHKKRLPHLRVVHRIDGSARDYGRTDNADALQRAANRLADTTIFQSAYSRLVTAEKAEIIRVPGPTIYNPANLDLYTPQGASHPALPRHGEKLHILSAIWSGNRRKGAWRIPALAAANPDVEFIYIGSAALDTPPANVRILPPMPREELAQAMRAADVFLNLSENDPCPNVVLEAMASGLPVLYVPSGGTPELVGEEGGLPFTDDAAFRPQLERIVAQLPAYREAARARTVRDFHPDTIFSQYLAAIKAAARRPLPETRQHLETQLSDVWMRLDNRVRDMLGRWR